MVHAGCVLVASIRLSGTGMSGSFKSVRWNACVHRLELDLLSSKKVSGSGLRSHVNSMGKCPLPEAQRTVKPAMLHHTGQQGQHTSDYWQLFGPLLMFHAPSSQVLLFLMILSAIKTFVCLDTSQHHELLLAMILASIANTLVLTLAVHRYRTCTLYIVSAQPPMVFM